MSFPTLSALLEVRTKKPVKDTSPLGQLKELPQPIGINGGAYTYWVDVTKSPLKFVASDGTELDEVSTLAGIEPWLDRHVVDDWKSFLNDEESLEYMREAGIIRVKRGRTDQQDHESRMNEAKKDACPVGVPNPSPEAKKDRKMAQAVVAGYTKHIKTSGLNQSYAKKHREKMNEGMWVVKSKDGIEKRFKDADSSEAKAWKTSEQKKPSKVKLAAGSQAYWETKDDGDRIVPWTKISTEEISDQFDGIARQQGMGRIEDWTAQGKSEMKVDDVDTATIKVRMMFSFGKEDDLGLDVKGDERVSDSQNIRLRRDTKDPKKLVFAGYI